MNALTHLFLEELAGCYDAGKRLVPALSGMAKSSTCKNLQKLLTSHMKETERRVRSVESVFTLFGSVARARDCDAVIGLLEEGDQITFDYKGTVAINAALILIAQKIAHHEIASYGCLRSWAALLGNEQSVVILHEILLEEKTANHAFSELARSQINEEALGRRGPVESHCDGTDARNRNVRPGMRRMSFGRAETVLA
ncbi:MAG TPA: DUF892 family protein [Roseimicrobium sp.]|nr:DUF892 family protein [Roseimicrobium sp.]